MVCGFSNKEHIHEPLSTPNHPCSQENSLLAAISLPSHRPSILNTRRSVHPLRNLGYFFTYKRRILASSRYFYPMTSQSSYPLLTYWEPRPLSPGLSFSFYNNCPYLFCSLPQLLVLRVELMMQSKLLVELLLVFLFLSTLIGTWTFAIFSKWMLSALFDCIYVLHCSWLWFCVGISVCRTVLLNLTTCMKLMMGTRGAEFKENFTERIVLFSRNIMSILF